MAKIANFNGRFVIVSHNWIRDNRLSLKAKGLICLLQSLPNGWDFSLAGITALSKDGIDATRAAINELREAGYLRWDRARNESGTFGDVIVEISETQLENPVSEKPILDYPMLENPTQYNIDNNKILLLINILLMGLFMMIMLLSFSQMHRFQYQSYHRCAGI